MPIQAPVRMPAARAVKRLAMIGLGLWGTVVIVVGGLLLAPHLISLPTPARADSRLRDAMITLVPALAGRWSAIHVMYRSCACSRRTIDHLLQTRRPVDLAELVLVVDDEGESGAEDVALRAAGFRVQVITPRTLHDRFHIDAAPLLVVMSPDLDVAYVGGYSRHKQSNAYEDLGIIAGLRSRTELGPLPVFGCATNARLANAIDPLGLRTW